MRVISNIKKTARQCVLDAASESGCSVQWRDAPDERMPPVMAKDYGSIVSPDGDLSSFWSVFNRLVAERKVALS